MELKREQIIKALECCTRGRKSKEDRPCLDCPYNECNLVGGTSKRQITGTCQGWLMKDALLLIKELTDENEMLQKLCKLRDQDNKDTCELLFKAEDENKRLRADTVRKMHSEIEARCIKGGIYPAFVKTTIDQIAKEMMEGL